MGATPDNHLTIATPTAQVAHFGTGKCHATTGLLSTLAAILQVLVKPPFAGNYCCLFMEKRRTIRHAP